MLIIFTGLVTLLKYIRDTTTLTNNFHHQGLSKRVIKVSRSATSTYGMHYSTLSTSDPHGMLHHHKACVVKDASSSSSIIIIIYRVYIICMVCIITLYTMNYHQYEASLLTVHLPLYLPLYDNPFNIILVYTTISLLYCICVVAVD